MNSHSRRLQLPMACLLGLFLVCTAATAQQAPDLTWQQTNGPEGGNMTAIVMTPEGHLFALSFSGGLYRWPHGGAGWTKVFGGGGTGYALAVGTWGGKTTLLLSTGGGMYYSTEDGDPGTWKPMYYDACGKTVRVPPMFAILTSPHYLYFAAGNQVLRGTFRATPSEPGCGLYFEWDHFPIDAGQFDATSIAADPRTPTTLYVGTVSHGIYMSTTEGQIWQRIWDGVPSAYVSTIAISPATGDVYAGTRNQEPEIANVYRGTYSDDLWTWVPVSTRLFAEVRQLSFVAGRLLAGTYQGSGIWYLNDEGDTWLPVGIEPDVLSRPCLLRTVSSFAVDSEGGLYAAAEEQDGVFYYPPPSQEGWTARWERRSTGLRAIEVSSLAVRDNLVFAGTLGAGIYRSTDNGANWTQLGRNESFVIWCSVGYRGIAINSAGAVLAPYYSYMIRSDDNGDTWRGYPCYEGVPCFVPWTLTVDPYESSPFRDNIYIAAAPGGVPLPDDNMHVYRSADGGATVSPVGSGFSDPVMSIVVHPDGDLFAGTWNGSIYRYDVRANETWDAEWSRVCCGPEYPGQSVQSMAVGGNGVIYAGTGGSALRSLDDGHTWEPLSLPDGFWGATSLAVHRNGTVVAGTWQFGVYVSGDMGTTWKGGDYGLADPTVGFTGLPVMALALASDGHVLAGTRGGGVYRSNETLSSPPNSPPVSVAVTAPMDPVSVNTAVGASATFADPSDDGTHRAVWDWGDGGILAATVPAGSGMVSGSHTYSAAGIYRLTLTVTDMAGASGSATFEYVVVCNPEGGFVTGGGWITSPVGAYAADPTLTGKASFGFNSKYQKGANAPTGQTEFQFKVASLSFRSTSYSWLVVAGARATYKGTGTINGSGTYDFMLSAIDGQVSGGGNVDKFRIKIWDGAGIVYDNQVNAAVDADPTTELGGGNIAIHKHKDASAKPVAEGLPAKFALDANYPNPFNPSTSIGFALPQADTVRLVVYNLQGQVVATPINGERYEAGRYAVSFDGTALASGVYLCRLQAGDFVQVRKMTLLR